MSFQVIEYKPGAGTVIGIDAVAKATPAGHTIGMVVSSFSINSAGMMILLLHRQANG